jgi:thiamine pyrophosphate-dependent acetolactate synthase large subunit-like protein
MSESLFTQFSVKGNLKYYRTEENEEKTTVGISINANHQIKANIYEDLSAFLEKLLIEDNINEQTYESKEAHEKALIKAEKEQEKHEKKMQKEKMKAITTKTTKAV